LSADIGIPFGRTAYLLSKTVTLNKEILMKVRELTELLVLKPDDAEVMVESQELNYPTRRARVSEPILTVETEDGGRRVFLGISGKTILPV
jgi:hypothetical protein